MRLEGSCHCGAVRFHVESHTPYPYMRCYCSICRKTAGGGGYAINLMGETGSLIVNGRDDVTIYRVRLEERDGIYDEGLSPAHRHFCRICGSALWAWDSRWPELVHPFASAIDTALPVPAERAHIMLESAASWVEIPDGESDARFSKYPDQSIEDWHRSRGLITN